MRTLMLLAIVAMAFASCTSGSGQRPEVGTVLCKVKVLMFIPEGNRFVPQAGVEFRRLNNMVEVGDTLFAKDWVVVQAIKQQGGVK